jgi:hypothetical protein
VSRIAATTAPNATPPAVARRFEAMPVSHRGTYRRALGGKSLRAAITAQCSECVGYDREAVRTCPAVACPLWKVRPWQGRRARGSGG